MEQFNTIPSSGNWSDIAALIDANFLRCYTALVQSESLVGLDSSNFQGIFTSSDTLPSMSSPGWALVGSSMNALMVYVYYTDSTQWAALNSTTYDFTDFTSFETEIDSLSSQVATIGSNLSDLSDTVDTKADQTDLDELASEMSSNHPESNEAGEYHVGEDLSVAYKYTSEGFDAAKLSSHFLSMISNGMAIGIAEMNEDGFAIVGENLNIAFLVDENGAHAANILEYENL